MEAAVNLTSAAGAAAATAATGAAAGKLGVSPLSYKHAFVCSAFYNGIGNLGFFIGILIDSLIIATYSRCHMQSPGASQFGFQMLILEFIDAIPEAMFLGESVSDGSIQLPIVLAICTLNIVNTMCTGFDLLARRGGSSPEDDADVAADSTSVGTVELEERVLRDRARRPPVVYGTAQAMTRFHHHHHQHKKKDDEDSALLDGGDETVELGEDASSSSGAHSGSEKSPTRLFLFMLINFSMGNILLSMMDEIYVEFEKEFTNTLAGWLQNGSLLLGTVIGVSVVMLIIAGTAKLESCSCGCGCCKGDDSARPPTFWYRLGFMTTSFLIVSCFALLTSGLCGMLCKALHDKNIIVIRPLFEGFSGGAFIGAVAGIMIPETTSQLHKSHYRGSWTQMLGMVMFVTGICCGMVTREYLFSQSPVVWSYCDFTHQHASGSSTP